MKFECPFCEYSSNRKYNLQSHINRKHNNEEIENVTPEVTPYDNISNNLAPNLANNIEKVTPAVTPAVTLAITSKALQCDTCLKIFSSRAAKSRHKKNVKCKPPPETVCQPVVTPTQYPVIKHTAESGCVCSYCQKAFSRVDNLKRHLLGCRIKRLTESGAISVTHGNPNNSTNTATNSNCNITTINNVTNNVTNNITIDYRSFDSPCLDHIDSDLVKRMYFDSNRNLKKLIKAGVCRIWKTPENNTFRLPFTDKPRGLRNTEIMQVRCDGEDQLFPAHHVVDVLLHKCATVCESYLRQHYYDESIPGTGVLKHANVLEELAIEFQETWDMDSQFRNEYKPFVRSAILECLQRKDDAAIK